MLITRSIMVTWRLQPRRSDSSSNDGPAQSFGIRNSNAMKISKELKLSPQLDIPLQPVSLSTNGQAKLSKMQSTHYTTDTWSRTSGLKQQQYLHLIRCVIDISLKLKLLLSMGFPLKNSIHSKYFRIRHLISAKRADITPISVNIFKAISRWKDHSRQW